MDKVPRCRLLTHFKIVSRNRPFPFYYVEGERVDYARLFQEGTHNKSEKIYFLQAMWQTE